MEDEKKKIQEKKDGVWKRNWLSEEQASLFSVFLSRKRVYSIWTFSLHFSLSSTRC